MNDDNIFIDNLCIEGLIGVFEEEQKNPQPILISLKVFFNKQSLNQGGYICYKKLSDEIVALIKQGHIFLVEDLAEKISCMGLKEPGATKIWVRVAKKKAILNSSAVGVEITRYQG